VQDRLLLIADAGSDQDLLRKNLEAWGYFVVTVASVQAGLDCLADGDLSLIVLALDSISSPTETNECFPLHEQLQAERLTIPLFHLLSVDDYSLRAASLKAGADDVLSRPYAWEELDARLKALLRRSRMGQSHADGDFLNLESLEFNTKTREVRRNDKTSKLTVKEYDLLKFLFRNLDQVVSRQSILHGVWGQSWKGDDNLLDVYIRYLRKKIEQEGQPQLVQTVKGVGYILKTPS
jgi:two-component system response regulator MprA